MRVLHLCLSCFYVDGAGYQENHLIRQNVDQGHDVLVLASTETINSEGALSYTKAGSYDGTDGARVIRLSYVRWLPHFVARKLRIYRNLADTISDFAPDVILFHGCAAGDIVTAAAYSKFHPEVSLYVDSHEDFNNSARSFASRYLLHRIYYRSRIQKALTSIKKILCVSSESIDFVRDVYGVHPDKLELYPLGGIIFSADEIRMRRSDVRSLHGLSDDDIILIQSGKMNERKNLVRSLEAFAQIPCERAQFWIVGVIASTIRHRVNTLISVDKRVVYHGWKSPEELNSFICAADAYIQPGTQSVTMQNALCCGRRSIIDDTPSHYFYRDAGVRLVHDAESLRKAMHLIMEEGVSEIYMPAYDFAGKKLDYRVLAQRYLT